MSKSATRSVRARSLQPDRRRLHRGKHPVKEMPYHPAPPQGGAFCFPCLGRGDRLFPGGMPAAEAFCQITEGFTVNTCQRRITPQDPRSVKRFRAVWSVCSKLSRNRKMTDSPRANRHRSFYAAVLSGCPSDLAVNRHGVPSVDSGSNVLKLSSARQRIRYRQRHRCPQGDGPPYS